MIATPRELTVFTRQDFESLPEDGRWEVANGCAVLVAPPKAWHQKISDRLVIALDPQLPAGRGFLYSAVSVFLPVPAGVHSEIQSRVPDLSISTFEIDDHYDRNDPPEWVIEILSTRRGNVERTEKMDDYASAGIQEYWVVNSIDREVEVYALSAGDYTLVQRAINPQSITFPGVAVDMTQLWPKRLT